MKVPISIDAPLLLPSRFAKSTKKKHENEILETFQKIQVKEILKTFRKVQVNIPLLDTIKQIPRYAKFLKKLYTNKHKLRGNEIISVGRICLLFCKRRFLHGAKIQEALLFHAQSAPPG